MPKYQEQIPFNKVIKKSKTKKAFKFFGFFVLFLILFAGAYLTNTYFQIQRGDLVKWDGEWQTKEELAKKYPPQYYDVPAKNTPEEVYATFRQALLDGDIELALEQIAEENKDKYIEIFNNQDILKKYHDIPGVKDIKKAEREIYKNSCSYYYVERSKDENKQIAYSIDFIKNNKGFWKIKYV